MYIILHAGLLNWHFFQLFTIRSFALYDQQAAAASIIMMEKRN